MSSGSLFYFTSESWGQVIAADVAWGRKDKDGDWGAGRKGKGGQERARLGALGPSSSVPLSPAPPPSCLCSKRSEVEKLDLSPSGQWPSPPFRGTQQIEEPQSQELGTASHPSSQSRLRQWKWVLLRSGVELGRPWEEAGRLTQGGPPHLLPPAAQLLVPRLRPDLPSFQAQRC